VLRGEANRVRKAGFEADPSRLRMKKNFLAGLALSAADLPGTASAAAPIPTDAMNPRRPLRNVAIGYLTSGRFLRGAIIGSAEDRVNRRVARESPVRAVLPI